MYGVQSMDRYGRSGVEQPKSVDHETALFLYKLSLLSSSDADFHSAESYGGTRTQY